MKDNETIDEATKMEAVRREFAELRRDRFVKYSNLTKEERALHKKLKKYQRMKANGIKADEKRIASNAALVEMAMLKPRSIFAIGRIWGFHRIRVEKYGEDLVSIISSHVESQESNSKG